MLKRSRPARRPQTRAALQLILVGVLLLSSLLAPVGAQAGRLLTERDPIWGAPLGDLPAWLQPAQHPDKLYSHYELSVLSGRLIAAQLVDASDCPANGYLPGGAANPCGVERARAEVIRWQNQFNAAIHAASAQTGVPPVLLKNIFAWESQFWPQTHFVNTYEYGLGHLTEGGADSLLRWNSDYYRELCRQNFWDDTCKKPYADQPTWLRAALRGVVVQRVNASCAECANGLDMELAGRSVSTFANTVLANANFVGLYINYNTGRTTNTPVSYEDLWKFTLVSYNAGPGCFQTAFWRTRNLGQPMTWENLSSQLDPACQGAVDYVAFASNTENYAPPPVPELPPTPTPEAPTAIPTDSTAQVTPEPTAGVETPTSESTGTPATTTETPVTTDTPATTTETPAATDTPATTETPTSEATPPAEQTPDPTPPPPALPPAGSYAADELVVRFKDFPFSLLAQPVLDSLGATVQSEIPELGVAVIQVPEGQLAQALASLQNNLLVEYVEPNFAVRAFYIPNDPFYASQAATFAYMQIPQAWEIARGNGALVAVIDTGLDTQHPDLRNNLWQNPGETGTDTLGNDKRTNGIDDDSNGYVDDWQGWNFAAANNDPSDDNNHGTHSAGLIAAEMDNATGMAGIAPGAQVMALKALDAGGFGTYAQVSEAIVYAANNGAKIINLGFGGSGQSDALQAAVNYAASKGALLIAAAGNTGSSSPIYPAAYPVVLSVGAVDGGLAWVPFSTFAPTTGLTAPGVDITSTLRGGAYGTMSGTSMAAAQVSGVAALLASQPQYDTSDKIRAALLGSALDLGAPGRDPYYGRGLARAWDALQFDPDDYQEEAPQPPTGGPGLPGDGVYALTDMAASSLTSYVISCSATTYDTPLGGTGVPGIQVNNAVRTVPIGFEFWYMGMRYTQVYVSSNGWLSFNNPGAIGAASLTLSDLDNANSGANTIYNTNARPIIAPLWDNLAGTATSLASYTTTGTAPNRVFTFEWWNYQWNTTSASRVSFRALLHESTGRIDFMYHQNNANNGVTASIGITGTPNNVFLSANDMDPAGGPNDPGACPTFGSVAENTGINRKPPTGAVYTFTPPFVALNAPGNLTLSAVTTTAVTLTWSDNSSGEDGFGIYTSTDGVNYTYVGQVGPNVSTFTASGLANSANNHWKVYAVVEGNASASANVSAPGALTFTDITPTSMTLNWADNSTNETGFLIYRSTDNVNFSFEAKTAANVTSYAATGLTPGQTYHWRVHAIADSTAENSISAAVSGSPSTPPNTLPVVNITTPSNGASYAKGAAVIFSGTALDAEDGNIGASLVWVSDINGPIGAGTGFFLSNLTPGEHTITAKVTDSLGGVGSASITLTINPAPRPHGDFSSGADNCAMCHRGHTAQSSGALLLHPSSATSSNDFCLSCHDGSRATAVSTHSNRDFTGAVEGQFELMCVQCHDPHGSSNLFSVRTELRVTLNPLVTTGPVLFTAHYGPNSYDDGVSPDNTQVCVACHSNPDNPGYPMVNHEGGANHAGLQDYTGMSCIACHPHTADALPATRDGFMPVRSTLP